MEEPLNKANQLFPVGGKTVVAFFGGLPPKAKGFILAFFTSRIIQPCDQFDSNTSVSEGLNRSYPGGPILVVYYQSAKS